MGEARRRKQLGNYPEQTKKPVRKPKRQVQREVLEVLQPNHYDGYIPMLSLMALSKRSKR